MTSEAPHGPPFRAEHLGSLLRPEKLLNARAAFDKAEVSKAELKEEEDAAIREIVQLQKDKGYHALTDGEYRRHSK